MFTKYMLGFIKVWLRLLSPIANILSVCDTFYLFCIDTLKVVCIACGKG